MVDTQWTLVTDGLGTLSALGVANVPSLTVGESASLELRQVEVSVNSYVLAVSAGTTISSDSEYTQVNVASDGSLNVSGASLNVSNDARTGHKRLRELTRYAGKYATVETLDSTLRYRDQLPTSVNFNSLVVKAEPSQDIQDRGMEPFYGLVSSGTDVRPPPLNRYPFDIELDVLATGSEYADISALKTDLEI